MPKPTCLTDLLITELQELYSLERQLIRALPALAVSASSEILQRGVLEHLDRAKTQAARLEAMMEGMGIPPMGRVCKPMEKLLDEGSETAAKKIPGHLRDVALVTTLQKTGHYEIASYEAVRAYANWLGLSDILAVFNATLAEERAANDRFSRLSALVVEFAAWPERRHSGVEQGV